MPRPLENLRGMWLRQGEGKGRLTPGPVAVQRILEVGAERLQKCTAYYHVNCYCVGVCFEIFFHVSTVEERENSSL